MKPFTVADYIAKLQQLPPNTICIKEDRRLDQLYATAEPTLRMVKARPGETVTHEDGTISMDFDWAEENEHGVVCLLIT